LTYSINFTSDGSVTSSAGIVSENKVINIPAGLTVQLTTTSNNGCNLTKTVNAPLCNCPSIDAPISGGDKNICKGQAIPNLNVIVGDNTTADWYDANQVIVASGTLSFRPITMGIYYVQARNLLNNCVSTTRTSIQLSVNTLPSLNVAAAVCSPDLLTYSVSFTSDGVVTSSAGIVSAGGVSSIPIGTNITLTTSNNAGCSSIQTINSPICTCPNVNIPISGGDKTICTGQTIPSLSVNIGENEVAEWYDAPSGGNLLVTGQNFIPSSEVFNGGLFYVQARNLTNNCISNTRALVKLNVNSKGEIPEISASKNPLILGETAILSISNCNGAISWNTGEKTNTISVRPKETTVYSAICTANGDCIGGKGEITIEVKAPKIGISASPNVVCVGGSTTLNMTGCINEAEPVNKIYWTSNEYGRRDEVMPTFNGIIQTVLFTGHCVTSAGEAIETITVSVRQPQDFQVIASKNPIILGESTILSATGCDGIVSWLNGQATGNPITVWPTSQNTEYIAECLSSKACGGKGKISIQVKPPSIAVTGKDVCWGAKPMLTQTGCASSYYWVVWKKDDFSDAKAIENPNTYSITEPTRFKVACSTTAGEGSGEILIRPIPLPETPKIIPNKGTYFSGETVELNVQNCSGYLAWSTGENGISQIRVKPSKTSTYTVNCQSSAGCNTQNSIEVIIKTPSPKVKDITLCYGETLVLNSGCVNNAGLWTENWLDIPNRITRKEGEKIEMITSNTFGVSCEGEAGLSEMVAFLVTVKPQVIAPEIQSKKRIIVKGESLELIANGCIATVWMDDKNTVFSEKSNKLTVLPTVSTTFSARCFIDGCYGDFTNFKVSVRPTKPKIKVSLDTLCIGNSTTISAHNCENGGILKWLENDNSLQEFTISPQKNTTFKAVCISLESTESLPLISDTTIVKIKVYQTPKKPVINGETVIIKGEKTTLSAKGCQENILWNTGEKSQSITVRPDKNTIYTATCGVWQCISDTAMIKIRVRPRQIEIQTNNGVQGYSITDTICLNKQLIIRTVNQCDGTIVWSNGHNGETIQVIGSRFETQKYSLYCINTDAEKSDESTAIITVLDYNVSDAIAYPNPTTGKLYIKSKGCIDGVRLILYSQRGEKLYEGGGQERYLDSIVLDLYHLPSETYILHIIGTDGNKPMILKKRIIKVNN
jgi:Ig-like domain CHU_C associated